MSEELKQCPFCGGEARIDTEYDMDGFGNFHKVECRDCGASSKSHFCTQGNECPQYYQEVREEWNDRPASDSELTAKTDIIAEFNAENARLRGERDELLSALSSTNELNIELINKHNSKCAPWHQIDMEHCHDNGVLLERLS